MEQQSKPTNFANLPVRYIYFILAGIVMGTLLGVKYYFSFMVWGEKFIWHRYFVPEFVNQTLWGFLVPLIYYFFLKYPLRDGLAKANKFNAIAASIGVATLHEIVSFILCVILFSLLGYVELNEKEFRYFMGSFPAGFVNQWIEYWIIHGFFMAIDFAKKYKDKQVELANIQTQLSDAKLNALKRQLQPHFLFNTLNTISSLMEINIKDAQKMVSKLGGLLRGVLDRDDRNMIPLREELAFIKNYLDIEQVRFHDRLSIRYNFEETTLDALVPSLILQPLVENAIKHGFSNRTEAGIITVITEILANNRIKMTVKDDGNGINLPIKNLHKKGIGLQNVKNRLALIYKENYSFCIDSMKNKGFEVSIILPHSSLKTKPV